MADVMRTTVSESRRRTRDAEQLKNRTTLTGQPVGPDFPATAKAWHSGLLDIEHLRVIQKFFRDLPDDIHPSKVAEAEAFLAEKAAEFDLIRMASHAHHYLCVFEEHNERPIYLGRTKRIASADQRIVLHAKDRGCTAPGCDMPGYLTEVHHVDEWADGGLTNIDKLTFACAAHHRLIKPGGWKTRKRKDGATEWLPPPHLPIKAGTNDFHHPERLLGRTGTDQ